MLSEGSPPLPVMCHMSRIMCHVSRVTCHMSCVTCQVYKKKNLQSGEFSRWRVCYQQGYPV